MAVKGTSAAARSADLMRRLKFELDYDPLVELIQLSRKHGTKDEFRKAIHCSLMPYAYPTIKAVDIDLGNQQPIVLNLDLSGSLKGVDAQNKLMQLVEESENMFNEETEELAEAA